MAARPADYRFARRPAWIAGHLLVVGLVGLMVSLGFWQLRRLDDRRATNALVEARSTLEPEDLEGRIAVDAPNAEVDELRFRAISATGTYEPGGTAVVRANLDGRPGGRVFSILTLADGTRVAVLRGFVQQGADGNIDPPPPPQGEVEVEGLGVPRRRFELVFRQALDDLADSQGELLPVAIQAGAADRDELVPVPPPDLGEGPHLAYAVQWFLFSAVGVVGYPFLLRKRAREAGA